MATLAEALNEALRHHQTGRLQEAETLYHQILKIQPDHADTLHLLGVIAHQLGRHDAAIKYITRAIALNPNAAEYHSNVGEVYRALARLDEAEASFERALSLKPTYAEAVNNLGAVLQGKGRLEEAATRFRQALSFQPAYAEAQRNLINVLKEQGKLTEVVAEYRNALKRTPHDIAARIDLVGVLYGQGQTSDAINVLFNGLADQPTNALLRGALASSLRGFAMHTASNDARAILLSLCQDDNVSTQNLVNAITGLTKNSAPFPALLNAAKTGDDPFHVAASEVAAFVREPLLLAALPRLIVSDAELELVMTNLRRWMLLRAGPTPPLSFADSTFPPEFMIALARQCFTVEHAWFVAKDEAKLLKAWRTRLQSALAKAVKLPRSLEFPLVILALYAPLHTLRGWESLLKTELSQWSGSFQLIVREQLLNFKREKEIATGLTALTEIKDAMSRKVRRQYEDNPYPRWVTLQRPQAVTVGSLARSLRPGEKFPEYLAEAPILVAGCGTGQHPIQVSMAFSDCRVLAIDLSRASLAYAARKSEDLGVTNIVFQQADLLELGRLKQRFAVIECGGVLHHLRDPLKGWRILVGLLQPHGLMKIALYSSRARRNIQAAARFANQRKFPLTAEGIRSCRRAIIDLPEGDPARAVLLSRDFFSVSGCRDLAMHVQEHTFDLQEIAGHLNRLGLRFLGFQGDAQLMSSFRLMFPAVGSHKDLSLWDRFEEANPDSFREMYQFWCCKT